MHRALAWWPRGSAALLPNAALSLPLLDATEIAELAQRLTHTRASALSPQEVAHRRLGESRSVFRGSGMDYDESRPFLPGDDPRAIDWRLTARSGVSHVKLFREERRPATFILLDRRATMRFGTHRRLKVTQAARVATLAAFDAQRRQSALAGVLLEGNPQWLRESAHGDAALRFAELAAMPAPPCKPSDEPDLQDMLARLNRLLLRGSQVWLISDLHDLSPACRGPLLALASEHQLRCVHIIDPAELALPEAGVLRLYPRTDGQGQAIDSRDPQLRRQYHEAATAFHAEREDLVRALQIPYVRLLSDTEAVEQVLPR
jgi:uncharacterized protein (DUF58 family)